MSSSPITLAGKPRRFEAGSSNGPTVSSRSSRHVRALRHCPNDRGLAGWTSPARSALSSVDRHPSRSEGDTGSQTDSLRGARGHTGSRTESLRGAKGDTGSRTESLRGARGHTGSQTESLRGAKGDIGADVGDTVGGTTPGWLSRID